MNFWYAASKFTSTKSTRKSECNSLHYYIPFLGRGFRKFNFIRLFSFDINHQCDGCYTDERYVRLLCSLSELFDVRCIPKSAGSWIEGLVASKIPSHSFYNDTSERAESIASEYGSGSDITRTTALVSPRVTWSRNSRLATCLQGPAISTDRAI